MSTRAQIHTTIEAVTAALDTAESEWSDFGSKLTAFITGRTDALGPIRSMRETVNGSWAPRGRTLANSSAPKQAAVTAWLNEGRDLLTNLGEISRDGATTELQDIIVDTVVETAKQTAEVAQTVVGGVASLARHWKILLAGIVVVLVLVVVVKVT